MIKKQNTRGHGGFTLIEMLVAIFIMTTLTFVSITNMRKGERQKRVAFAADGVVNALRVAQNYALSGKVLPESATCANRSPVAYKVSFNRASNEYVLSVEDYCNTSPSPVVERYTFPENTSIRSGGMNICNPGCNSSEVVVVRFVPPFGKMTVASSASGSFAGFNSVTVTVQDLTGTLQKVVTVDGISGRVGE